LQLQGRLSNVAGKYPTPLSHGTNAVEKRRKATDILMVTSMPAQTTLLCLSENGKCPTFNL
jgi:hypothetical protein